MRALFRKAWAARIILIAMGLNMCATERGIALVTHIQVVGSDPYPLPSGLTNAISIVGGSHHVVALKQDGTVAAWGDNSGGQTSVPPGLSNVVAITAGSAHNLALTRDGTVVGWGYNLDDFGNYSGQATPPAGLSNVVSIAAGGGQSLAAKSDGMIVGWGVNGNGQATPPPGLSNVIAVGAGSGAYHSLALKADGTVVAWAYNNRGQASVPAGLNSVRAIAGGSQHSVALKNDGTVAVWGYSFLPPGLANVATIAAADGHTVAFTSNRTVIDWGPTTATVPVGLSNVIGATASGLSTFVIVADSPMIDQQPTNQFRYTGMTAEFSVEAIGAGPLHYQWQFNGVGIPGGTNSSLSLTNVQLSAAGSYRVVISNAYETTVSSNATLTVASSAPLVEQQPVDQVVWLGRSARVSAAIAGSWPLSYQWKFEGTNIPGATRSWLQFDNARLTNEGTYCLTASNALGQVTTSNAYLTVTRIAAWTKYFLSPLTPPPRLHDVIAVSASTGVDMMVALRSNGTVVAWGDNSYGQTNVPPDLTNAVAVAAGWGHVTALKSDGTVVCWGNNDEGQAAPPPDLSDVVAIATETFHNLALKKDGTVVGWGRNNAGQINTPANLFGVIAIACGWQDSLVLRSDGTVIGWGDGYSGQLGVPANLSNVVAITAGTYHTLALKEDGTMAVWGANYSGAFPGPLNDVVAIAADPGHSLALRKDGTVSAWGFNYLQGWMAVPSGLSNVVALAASEYNHVALLNDGFPTIARPPMGRTVATNSPTSFSVGALGTAPLSYQWQFQGANISGATNSSLTLTNVQWADEGEYRVIVSNASGAVASAPAFLNAVDLGEVLNTTNLIWTTGGNAPWSFRTAVAHDQSMAAQSGAIIVGQQSTLQTSVTGPGTLKFWWKSATLGGCSWINFSTNGGVLTGITGDVDWQEQTFYLPPGDVSLLWTYANNCYQSTGAGTCWLDEVSFAAGPTLPTITIAPTDQTVSAGSAAGFSVAAVGTPPLRYQWQLNGANLPDATNTSILITNVQQFNAGIYSAVVMNDYGTSATNATLTVVPALSISSQPASLRKTVHGDALFKMVAKGSEPFSYQWQFNGANINDATNSTLALADLQISDSGNYRVIVSNLAGVLASSNASLTVSHTLVIGWGFHTSGQTNVPITLTNPLAISAGLSHGLALREDGSVLAWGDWFYGQTNTPAGLSNVIAVSAGYYHNLALKTDGTVVAWGAGTITSFPPYLGQSKVPTDLSNVVAIAAGGYHSAALRADGAIVAWGDNTYGQTNAPAGVTNVAKLAAGQYHTLALRRDGTVVAWGAGTNTGASPRFGQSKVPVGLSNVIAIAAGGYHSAALKSDGTVVAWGANNYLQTNVPGMLSDVVAISAGLDHTIALRRDGTAVAWGAGTNFTSAPNLNQSKVPLGLSNVVGVAAGGYHTVALLNDGSPFVLTPPSAVTTYIGSAASFAVTALGAEPLTYQWKFNVSDIVGATNSSLFLNNAFWTNSGAYRVIIRNLFGETATIPVTLTLIRTPLRFEVLSLQSNNFSARLLGASDQGPVVILTSSNLVDWLPIFTNPPTTGSITFSDPILEGSKRFYLGVEMAGAIQFNASSYSNGANGSAVRLGQNGLQPTLQFNATTNLGTRCSH